MSDEPNKKVKPASMSNDTNQIVVAIASRDQDDTKDGKVVAKPSAVATTPTETAVAKASTVATTSTETTKNISKVSALPGPLMRQGFRYSARPFDYQALLYTTLEPDFLVSKLQEMNYKWVGNAAPKYVRGDVDFEYGLCNHCKEWRWGCHEIKFGKYCFNAVVRFQKERRINVLTVEDAYVAFLNLYNRAFDYIRYDIEDDPDKEEEPELFHSDHVHPPKCMMIGSLETTLQWAYWREERRKTKRERKRIRDEWLEKNKHKRFV